MSKQKRVDPYLELEWQKLLGKLEKIIGKRPQNMEAVLFLIGMRELGKGARRFSKEQKQDLMHIAVCRVLSKSGFYELEGVDEEGWPHWKLVKPLPKVDLLSQEALLMSHIIDYFYDEGIVEHE
ncbi:MAG: hypothetical protein KatS3mg033_1687 [Thermonema sp.]|jgi:hypothetical protein|uniref:hypothetical protein n=1 Tax=Thermonema TaxID=28194 RepID=UPI000570E44D|nr:MULTISPECIES: hypothetical protein [Thermonema]GIV39887.1 MAG: hypothetical protein KatS3mg033_1687 [Thermonema sp.]